MRIDNCPVLGDLYVWKKEKLFMCPGQIYSCCFFGNSMPQNKDGQFVSCFIGYKWYVNDKDPQRKEIPVCFWGYFDKYWAN